MVEETNDAVVSAEEIKKVETEVLAKEKVKEDALRKEVETQVRKEIADKAEADKLISDKEKLEATVLAEAEEKKKLEEEKTQEIEDLKKQIGSTKNVVSTENPFRGEKDSTKNSDNKSFINGLSEEQLQEIDEKSKEAFMNTHGMRKGEF